MYRVKFTVSHVDAKSLKDTAKTIPEILVYDTSVDAEMDVIRVEKLPEEQQVEIAGAQMTVATDAMNVETTDAQHAAAMNAQQAETSDVHHFENDYAQLQLEDATIAGGESPEPSTRVSDHAEEDLEIVPNSSQGITYSESEEQAEDDMDLDEPLIQDFEPSNPADGFEEVPANIGTQITETSARPSQDFRTKASLNGMVRVFLNQAEYHGF